MANKSDRSLLLFKELVIAGAKNDVPKATSDPLLAPVIESLSDEALQDLSREWHANQLLPPFRQILDSHDPVQAASDSGTLTGSALATLPNHDLLQLQSVWRNSLRRCPSGITENDA